uniref:Uncharacterized protein n=1 Tax=Cyclopterus lumpus TaxID=8103 RepID=A0A8C3A7W6_CYCLU
ARILLIIVFLQRAGRAFSTREHQSLLTTHTHTHSRLGSGFTRYGADDTALNGIRLICAQDDNRSFLYSVESHTGYFGDWSQPQYCPSGVLASFQLRVEPHQGLFGDDTAVNNIKFRCSSNPTLEGQECRNGGICGIETKVEEYQYGLDDSSLNDVRFHCCAKPQQVRREGVRGLCVEGRTEPRRG